MRKTFLTLAMCLLAVATMTAQEEAAAPEKPWKFDGTVGLNAAATGLVNWAAGGKNNVNGLAYAKLHLLYSKDVFAWETNFDTDFGMTWIDQKEDAFQKSSDNIKLATKFGWQFAPTWYLTALASFQSQYALGRKYEDGYNQIISKWLAPSYTDISVGIDWKKSVNGADFSIYLSPVAGRITSAYIGEKWNKKYTYESIKGPLDWNLSKGVIDQETYDAAINSYNYEEMVKNYVDVRSLLQGAIGTYTYDKSGDPQWHNYRAELGLSFKGSIAYTYNDFKLSTTLALFTPYQGKGFSVKEAWLSKPNEDGTARTEAQWQEEEHYFEYSNNNRYFGNFDVDWDVALSYQFLKCLQVTLQTNLKYYPGTLIADKDGKSAERVQFKGVIGIGVGYSF